MKKMTFLAALLLAVPVQADTTKGKPVTVPFKILKTGHMTVEVKVNGKGPYTLIFDTGAPITLLNNKIAKETGLLKDAPAPLIPLFGSVGEVKVKTLSVGPQTVKDCDAIVMDHPTVAAISKAFGPIDGIVGFPFFARFRMTLDYQAKTLTLVPSGFKPPNVMAAMQSALLGGLGGGGGPQVITTSVKLGISVAKGTEDAGVTIRKVLPNSPAARAGLKKGDQLLTLDGRWTDSVADTYTAASMIKPGETVKVKIKRGDREMTMTMTPSAGF